MGEQPKRTSEEIEREIALARQNLLMHVSELQEEVREKMEWRRPVQQRPFVFLGAAFAIGFLIAWK